MTNKEDENTMDLLLEYATTELKSQSIKKGLSPSIETATGDKDRGKNGVPLLEEY